MSLPFFKMYPAAYESKASHLTLLEDGAYFRLLRVCWATPGCSIPDDEEWIFRRLRATTDAERDAIRTVLSEFFVKRRNRLHNPRLSEEHARAKSVTQTRSNNGKKGGRPRKQPETNEKEESLSLANEKLKKANKDIRHKNKDKTPKPPEGGQESLLPQPGPKEILMGVLPEEAAQDFIDHRKALKKPLTDLAATRLVKQLREMADPVASVDNSIANGWAGVFETQKRGQREQSGGDAFLRRVQRKYGIQN